MSAITDLLFALVQGLIDLTVILAQLASRPLKFVCSSRYRAEMRQRWTGKPARYAMEMLSGVGVLAAFFGLAFWWILVINAESGSQPNPAATRHSERDAFVRRILEKVPASKERHE